MVILHHAFFRITMTYYKVSISLVWTASNWTAFLATNTNKYSQIPTHCRNHLKHVALRQEFKALTVWTPKWHREMKLVCFSQSHRLKNLCTLRKQQELCQESATRMFQVKFSSTTETYQEKAKNQLIWKLLKRNTAEILRANHLILGEGEVKDAQK